MTKASIEQETWECSLGNKFSMLRKKHEILDSNVSVTLTKNHSFKDLRVAILLRVDLCWDILTFLLEQCSKSKVQNQNTTQEPVSLKGVT